MDVNQLIKLLVVCSVIVLPALAVTTRFALRPIVDAILRLKQEGMSPAPGPQADLLRAEIQELREEMTRLRQTVTRMHEVAQFERALHEPPEPPALPRPR